MEEKANNSDVSGGSPAAEMVAVRWESFLPKMVLRVLLVEADDSTRQIITLLLKKCNYKVAAVSDGLKAWELLNGKPENFDLILTEVELPSISGYPLLTLIMKHEICKNIPVIMMSAQDSVSTVYKCMLQGAADFLVKPLRKNELRNLWQHVWRRQAQSSSGEPGPLEVSTGQQKIEVTAENNANNSCDLVCIQKNREFIEKGNDAQSCTKPVLDAVGGAEVECALGLLPNMNINKHSSYPITDKKVQSMDVVAEESKEPAALNAQDSESVREVIDLIGQFDNYLKRTPRTSANVAAASNLVDPLPELSLSLKRDSSSISVDEVTEEKNMLNHSESSPFSRYVSHNVQPQKDRISFSDISVSLPPAAVLVKDGVWVDSKVPLFRTEAELEAAKKEYYKFTLQKLDSASSATDSPNSSNFQNVLPVGKEKADAAPILSASEFDRQETFRLIEGSSTKSAQRAAALEKFRLKRKDRCYEKKVRYESRQKLAEKRPRIRGQFVRQGAEGSSSPGSSPPAE